MSRSVAAIVALGLVLQSPTAAGQQRAPVNPHAAVLADFADRLEKYVDMRKSADDAAPPLEETAEPAEIRAAQEILAKRIRTARAGARQGDIFSPEIARHFRRLLRPETRERPTKEAIEEDNPGNIPFKVNGTYAEEAPVSTVPPNVLATLPKLPEDIEYRFVGKHLILRDARANLVIDYLLNAIP